MPAASATSWTLTSSKPRSVNRSMATLEMWSQVVERRRPTRCSETGRMLTPFRLTASVLALDAILLRPRSHCRYPTRRKVLFMEPNQQVDTETQLVTETLVEEVSIDGMCGVY